MSTGRVLWIIWCTAWAGLWFFVGALTLVGFVGVPLALAAILLPVGKTSRPGRLDRRHRAELRLPLPGCRPNISARELNSPFAIFPMPPGRPPLCVPGASSKSR